MTWVRNIQFCQILTGHYDAAHPESVTIAFGEPSGIHTVQRGTQIIAPCQMLAGTLDFCSYISAANALIRQIDEQKISDSKHVQVTADCLRALHTNSEEQAHNVVCFLELL